MNHSQTPATGRRSRATVTPLLHILRDARLYPALRALLDDQISMLLTGAFFTFEMDGDEVLVDEADQRTLVASIGAAIGNPRLRLSQKRLRRRTGELTLVLSPAAKQALLLEMASLLAHLSGHDLKDLPPADQSAREVAA